MFCLRHFKEILAELEMFQFFEEARWWVDTTELIVVDLDGDRIGAERIELDQGWGTCFYVESSTQGLGTD